MRRCKLCQETKPDQEFRFEDAQGQRGWSRRCRGCRHRGYQPDPKLPVPRVYLTHHVLVRYMQRLAPELLTAGRNGGMVIPQARNQLIRLIEHAPWVEVAPAWAGAVPRARDRGYLVLSDDAIVTLRYVADPSAAMRRTETLNPGIAAITVLTRKPNITREMATAV